MAIEENDVIHVFGTQDDLDDTSASVADGGFSITGDLLEWTNDDDAPEASVTLNATFSVTPSADAAVNLYLRAMNINGTSDQPIPDANFPYQLVGTFPVDLITSAHDIAINISLPNNYSSQIYQIYIENNAGQTMSAGWTIFMTPKSVGPHPA